MEGDGLEGSARVSDFLPRISCSIGIVVVVVVDNSAESGMGWLESRTADCGLTDLAAGWSYRTIVLMSRMHNYYFAYYYDFDVCMFSFPIGPLSVYTSDSEAWCI